VIRSFQTRYLPAVALTVAEMIKMRGESRRRGSSEQIPMKAQGIRRAMVGAKAGVPKYTREIFDSVRDARQAKARAAATDGAIIDISKGKFDADAFTKREYAAAWIGHATVLMRVGGKTILTDPVFSERVGMTLGGVTFGVRRVVPAAIDIAHLPKIDLVLLSHAHFDHLDRPSLRRLAHGAAHGATVVTAKGTRRLVPGGFGQVLELPWHHDLSLGGVKLHALQPVHWGARTAIDRHRKFNSYLIEGAGKRTLFAGDTAATDSFNRVGATDLSIFGIGAYDPWEEDHATPEQVWKMYVEMSGSHAPKPAGRLMAMHHSTFRLGREPLDEPMKRLLAAAGENSALVFGHKPGDLWCERDGLAVA
jgi:L-ascorbate metabolism protein UlaG (beta-lactamase superfamily)